MAITDNEIVRFSNEQVRPYCEKMRNMYWEFKSLATYWADTIYEKTPNDPNEIVEDGRDTATELTGEDIHNFVAEAGKFIIAMEQTGVISTIQKPCVRHLQANEGGQR